MIYFRLYLIAGIGTIWFVRDLAIADYHKGVVTAKDMIGAAFIVLLAWPAFWTWALYKLFKMYRDGEL